MVHRLQEDLIKDKNFNKLDNDAERNLIYQINTVLKDEEIPLIQELASTQKM